MVERGAFVWAFAVPEGGRYTPGGFGNSDECVLEARDGDTADGGEVKWNCCTVGFPSRESEAFHESDVAQSL
jgi:hypothetical protein